MEMANEAAADAVVITESSVDAGLAPHTSDAPVASSKHKKRTSSSSTTSVVRPSSGDDSLLDDLQQIKKLFANNHLSDVLFVFASEKRVATTTAHDDVASASKDDVNDSMQVSEAGDIAPEHHLLPAHRLILALRSGTFQSALLRTKSSQVPSQVRFPLKIYIQDTPYRVFAALVRFLYTNEVADHSTSPTNANGATSRDEKHREEFWKELLRASFVYLVPSLLEMCVQQIVQMLNGGEQATSEVNADWRPELLRKILDVLVFTDSVLAAKHPAAATRRVSKKAVELKTPVSPRSGAKENGSLLHEQPHETEEDGDDLGFAKCSASIVQLQYLCMSKLKSVPDRQFEALVHTEVGRRCTTERLCAILKQRSDTPLVVAIRYQLGRVVNELLKLGEPLDKFFNDESDLPLVAALKTGNDAIIRRLLVDDDTPYFLLTDKIPLFFLACSSGNVQHCQILIEQSNVQVNMISQLEDGDKEIVAEFGRGQTPLHIASRKGHSKVVELLLHSNAVSNLQDEEGNTALHAAGNMETVEMLLSSSFKTNPNIPNRRGQTPLHVAAAKGNVGIVDLLIRSGCQQDILDDQGQTAFHVAAANGHTSVALILLRENESFERAQSYRKKSEKLTPSPGGGENGDDDAQSGTDDNDSDSNASQFVVNQEDLKGNTALHLAAMSPSERCQKMIQLLLENGADPNHANWFGYTPLHLFCSHQSGPDSVIDVFVSVLTSFLSLREPMLTYHRSYHSS